MKPDFKRKPEDAIAFYKNSIRAHRGWITKKEEKIRELVKLVEELSVESFFGRRIISESETTGEYGKVYKLIVSVSGYHAIIEVFPDMDTHGNKFVVQYTGINIAKKEEPWAIKEFPKREGDVYTFEKAVQLGQQWLEELIKRLDEKGL